MSALMRPIAMATLAVAIAFTGPAAFAHAALQRAEPKVGGTVNSPPSQVQLWFSEPVEPAFSKAVVKNAAGVAVNAGDSKVAADDKHRLDAPVGVLPLGVYKVEWSVVSIDGHKTEGSFTFTVSDGCCRSPAAPSK